MSEITITGKDVLKIDDELVTGLGDGDCGKITFPNDIGTLKVGKDGNALYALNSSGLMAELTIKVLRGTADDKRLQARLQEWINDPASFILVQLSLAKRLSDGKGRVTTDVYQCADGIFKKIPEAVSNAEGDVAQAEIEYTIVFRNGARALQ